MRETFKRSALSVLLLCALPICGAQAAAQDIDVTVRVELRDAGTNTKVSDASEAVVWVSPLPGTQATATRIFMRPPNRLRLAQHSKSFEPHLLVLPVGSEVEFPNRDPFFHNVFPLFEGKRFDLGLYEDGTTRNVVFDRPGISYIFCNIHSEMSAVVIALQTPYYGVSNPQGEILIPSVPSGRYVMHVWHQSSLPEVLDGLTREITVSRTDSSLGIIRLTQTTLPSTHKNKYGHDYEPPAPTSPGYKRP